MNLDEAKQASANYFSITLLSFVSRPWVID